MASFREEPFLRRSPGQRRNLIVAGCAIALGLVLFLLLAEAALQVAGRASRGVQRLLAAPWEVDVPLVPDERLISRGSLLRLDHDAAGYRNAHRLRRAEIVTLGDSMTYGPVDPQQAWPRILSTVSGRVVYNMALPSYGPAQSLLQLDDALALRPSVVIVAPYFGNDLFDTFTMTLRHPALAVVAPADLLQRANDLEQRRGLRQEVVSPFTVGFDGTQTSVTGLRRWASEHVQLFRLARTLRHRLAAATPTDPLLSRDFALAAAALTPARRQSLSAFEGDGWRTILGGRYRFPALNDADPRIRVGFLVMGAALEEMATRSRTAGVRLIVVLFPTKESVFWPRVSDPDRHPGLRELVAAEARLRAELAARLEARDVEMLDLLELFRGAPEQPYHEDVDGHPNPAGNRLVASTLEARLRAR